MSQRRSRRRTEGGALRRARVAEELRARVREVRRVRPAAAFALRALLVARRLLLVQPRSPAVGRGGSRAGALRVGRGRATAAQKRDGAVANAAPYKRAVQYSASASETDEPPAADARTLSQAAAPERSHPGHEGVRPAARPAAAATGSTCGSTSRTSTGSRRRRSAR